MIRESIPGEGKLGKGQTVVGFVVVWDPEGREGSQSSLPQSGGSPRGDLWAGGSQEREETMVRVRSEAGESWFNLDQCGINMTRRAKGH